MLRRTRAIDPTLLGLLEEGGRNVQRAALLLRDLVVDYPERAELDAELELCEKEGDRITHDTIHRLNADGLKPGLGRADGHALATALDDVVDFAEQAGGQFGLYRVEASMEQAIAMCDVLVGAAEQVARALRSLRGDGDLATHLVEIHRLENEGDRVMREALGSLFSNGIDPMVVIRWKDIFESLEGAVDACESVAHVLEGIALKRR